MDLFGIPSGTWSEIAALAAILQTLIIIVALVYAYLQTRQLKSQIRLGQIGELRRQWHLVNEFLLRDDMREYADEIQETKQGVFASVMFNTFGAIFDLYDAGQTSEKEWEASKISIRDAVQYRVLWKHWCGDPDAAASERVAHRLQYAPRFRKVIDALLPLAEIPERVRPKPER